MNFISDVDGKVLVHGKFDESCLIDFSEEALKSVEEGKLKIKIHQRGARPCISNFNVYIGSHSGSYLINVANDNSSVYLGEGSSGVYDFRLWRKSKIVIGENTTSNGIKVVCDNSEFLTGSDCMFSDGILIQTADQHGIVDISRGSIVNNNYKSVVLGDHVWVGRNSTLTSNARVGEGAVIGTGSIVTGRIPSNVVAVGVPAKVIKNNYTWSRFPESLDGYSKKIIDKDY